MKNSLMTFIIAIALSIGSSGCCDAPEDQLVAAYETHMAYYPAQDSCRTCGDIFSARQGPWCTHEDAESASALLACVESIEGPSAACAGVLGVDASTAAYQACWDAIYDSSCRDELRVCVGAEEGDWPSD